MLAQKWPIFYPLKSYPLLLPMKTKQTALLVLLATSLVSCIQQQQQRYHQSSMTPEQWEASERYINQVEDQSFAFRDRERMSNARATEMATRHNPTHVTNNSTSLWVW